ncbi:hypothetical protein BOX15_Mlig032391g1 [Macrostomum lignano]|uniref:Death domain-containing protein n=2 Tax=Macrostomum lignano TaxID=282301 RepID=A0A267EWE1_9PLAT|nr:hypothetical protein BOX15_Mlig032391g1 [Macrostomum lignano]
MPSQSPSSARKKKTVTFGSAPTAAGGKKSGKSGRASRRSAKSTAAVEPVCDGCEQLRAAATNAAAKEASLVESNLRLQQEATRLAAEVNRLQEWQRLTREKILINCPEWAMAGVPPDDPDRLLDCLIWAAQHPPSAESRLVDLETRVTQLGGEFSRCAGRCLLFEGVLEELLRSRLGPDQVHEVISDAFLATGKSVRDALDRKDGKDPRQLTSMSENAVQAVTENQDPSALLDDFERKISLSPLAAFPDRSNVLTLKPPAQRLPGCTPISQMNRDLRQWICLDLNMERRAGNDWRMLADRLGFADSVPAWSGLASPMAKLLTEWSRSESATVRLLHRHLASPELRAPLLAKRLQQFYRVD